MLRSSCHGSPWHIELYCWARVFGDMAALKELPLELLIEILRALPTQSDMLSFTLVDKETYRSLDYYRYLYNIRDKNSFGLLLSAACGAEGATQKFLDFQADPQTMTKQASNTPLSLAATFGHVKVVRVLLLNVAVDVNHQNWNGDTPLHLAARYGYVDVVEMLLGVEGVCPDLYNKRTETPLLVAANNGRTSVEKILERPDVTDDISPERNRSKY